MARQTALLGLLAAMLPAGCNRTDAPPRGMETVAPMAAAPAGDRLKADGLAKPVPVEVDGKRLARDHAALVPFVGDLDGDGRQDLLLGTREKGRLLVYRNVGTNASPRLSGPRWFDDTVPTGSIPSG